MSDKRRGRPPGQPNREYEIVEVFPASCPTCGSTKLANVRGATPAVESYPGEKYDRVVWRRKQCECGQFVSVRTYEKENATSNKTSADAV
jgi:hypothetical protein